MAFYQIKASNTFINSVTSLFLLQKCIKRPKINLVCRQTPCKLKVNIRKRSIDDRIYFCHYLKRRLRILHTYRQWLPSTTCEIRRFSSRMMNGFKDFTSFINRLKCAQNSLKRKMSCDIFKTTDILYFI